MLDCDFREVRFADQGRFNVYLFDGPHGAIDHYDGLALALPSLDPEFVFIVDDWNWAAVRMGTSSAIKKLGLEIVHAIEVRTTTDDTHPPHSGFDAKSTDWHNGYFIAVLKKRARIGSRFKNALTSRWTRLATARGASKARADAENYASNPVACQVLALITHHYAPERLQWLAEVLGGLAELGVRRTHALIVTNTADAGSLANIRNAALSRSTRAMSVEVVTAPPLLHPRHLPWAQKPLIEQRFVDSASTFTHVVSLEDDIAFGPQGFRYWLEYRAPLAHGLIPSFLRTEMRIGCPVSCATDAVAVTPLGNSRSVRIGAFTFIVLDNPYCAMFVLDRSLAREYVTSRSFLMGASMSVSPWPTRERAAMGLCWEHPPPGFAVRSVVAVD